MGRPSWDGPFFFGIFIFSNYNKLWKRKAFTTLKKSTLRQQ